MSYDLSKRQKDNIRRLTQRANRRIMAVEREFKKQGLKILPADATGGIQTKQQWETKGKPLSRSVQFESKRDYQRRLKELQTIAGKTKERDAIYGRRVLMEHTREERRMTIKGIESSLGREITPELRARINNMSAAEVKEFWVKYDNQSAKLGIEYSSGDAMERTMHEYFDEDYERLAG